MAGLPRAPPEDLNPPGLGRMSTGPHYAARRTSSAKLSFAFRNGPLRWPNPRESNTFTRPSKLVGPMLFPR